LSCSDAKIALPCWIGIGPPAAPLASWNHQ
jgi:hypothetical protein